MTYFVVSDIHSFFDEFKKAIDEAGFDPTNENHRLIICGDLFDRGSQPLELIRYLNLETPNAILIRGNHEDLFVKMCERGEPLMNDYSNRTAQTVYGLVESNEPWTFQERANVALGKVTPILERMVDYYETEHYIFVHGWIPCISERQGKYSPIMNYAYWSGWRDATAKEWENARWYNGMDCADQGVIEPNKIIVCGHWHCSYGHWLAGESDYPDGVGADYTPYYGNGIIAIDACTAYSGKVNCIVIND